MPALLFAMRVRRNARAIRKNWSIVSAAPKFAGNVRKNVLKWLNICILEDALTVWLLVTDMKENKKRKHTPAEDQPAIPKAKTVRDSEGKVLRQYPPEVGFHGSDREKGLNPEE